MAMMLFSIIERMQESIDKAVTCCLRRLRDPGIEFDVKLELCSSITREGGFLHVVIASISTD
jgi:hypothetical protein